MFWATAAHGRLADGYRQSHWSRTLWAAGVRRGGVICVVLAGAVVAALTGTAALAQPDQQIQDIRVEREELARSAAEVAKQVDALAADDAALVAALSELETYIELQLARIDAAEKSIAAAIAEAAAARAEVAWLQEEITAVRERLRQRAIEVFVQAPADVIEQLASGDLNESAVRLFLIERAVGSELEITDELRTVEARLEVVRRSAVEKLEEAERERAAQQQRLAELEDARLAAEEYRAEIQRRIDEYEREAAEIERIDEEMEREIFAIEEELRRAEAERRRLEEQARRRAVSEQRQAHEAANGPFELVVWPVGGEKTSGFGPRVHPILGSVRQHQGIDLDGDTGDRVGAARSGEVIVAGWRSGYGNTVVVYHGLGYSTLYSHLSSISVSVGDQVSSGDKVGAVGSTGLSTGPHLHFELRIDGRAVDPTPYLP